MPLFNLNSTGLISDLILILTLIINAVLKKQFPAFEFIPTLATRQENAERISQNILSIPSFENGGGHIHVKTSPLGL